MEADKRLSWFRYFININIEMIEDRKGRNSGSSTVWSGLVIVVIGLVFLLKNLGMNIPDWIFNWPCLLVAIGLLIGYKRKFTGGGWLIMVLVGGFFMFKSIPDIDLSKYYLAVAIMIFGVFLMFKPKNSYSRRRRWKEKLEKMEEFRSFAEEPGCMGKSKNWVTDENDVLDTLSIFGGTHQNIHSKNFKGGDAIAIFGGCDVNLTQADFEGVLRLDVVAIFGGVKIIIPPSWEVKSDVVAIFGGLEDKRTIGPVGTEPRKIVKISGVAMFGGVEIKNF